MSCNENVEETLLTMQTIFFLFLLYITSSSFSILRETGKAVIGGVLSGNRRSVWGGRPQGVMGLGCEGAIYASGLRAPRRWEYFNDRRLSQILSLYPKITL